MPYEKILELVEAKQLDITTVSLAEITGDFIKQIVDPEFSRDSDPQFLADFVVVAAKLILIKSKALLPSLQLTEEEEGDIKEFEERLKLYKAFKSASENIKKLWDKPFSSVSRPYLARNRTILSLENRPEQAQRSEGLHCFSGKLKASDLLTIIQKLTDEVHKLTTSWQKNQQTIKIKVISLESKIKELVNRFASLSSQKFSQLLNSQSRGEIVATFLAVLHLLKDRVIHAEQSESFEEIRIKKI